MHRAEVGAPDGLNALFPWLPALMILAFVITGMLGVSKLSLTADEAKHYRYGQDILAGNAARFDDSKMPISALNALPARLADFFPPGAIKTALQKFILARLVTMLFSALVAFVIFRWARRLYGDVAGLAALALYVFDPNILANSPLVTTDIYAAGTTLFAVYGLWQFAQTRRWRDGWLCAFLLGLSLLAKYTSIVLLPLFILTLAIHDWPGVCSGGRAAILRYLGRLLGCAAAGALVCLLLVNIGFLFDRSFTAFGDFQFRSGLFQQLQQDAPALAKLPVPVPYPYLEGLDLVYMREQTGFGYGRIYFLGQLSENKGFAGYYFVAFLLKEPLASQMIILSALIAYILHKKYARFRQNELFLFIPAAFFCIYFNFFYNAQIGIRFYFVIFPLLYIFAGSFFEAWERFRPSQKTGAYILFACVLLSTFSYYPHFLTYFNEIVWDRKTAYKYLADSNIDWEQGKFYLKDYLDAHPQADYAPKSVKPGQLVVSVNDLVGVTALPSQYAWLRENFKPVDAIANEYLVYHISSEDYAKLCASSAFCK